MKKITSDVTKKWIKYAVINVLMFTILYGAIAIGYAVYALKSKEIAGVETLEAYASTLASKSIEEIKAATNVENAVIDTDFIQPQCSFALYIRRPDDTLAIYTRDEFITFYGPKLNAKMEVVTQEKIANFNFITYSTMVSGKSDAFIKVFMVIDMQINAANNMIGVTVVFLLLFIAISIGASIAMGYLEIKPVLAMYEKQRAFINDMSHEIRTPLTVIKGNVENVLATPNLKISEVSETLQDVLNETEYMSDMSNGLLNIVRSSSNSGKKKETDLSELVGEVVEVYSDLISEQERSLIANIENVGMRVDKEKIKQLLVILIENAIKYTNSGDKIKIKLKKAKDGCVLSVSDTGIGVNENDLDKIFDRFFRAENAKDYDGTGLGLAIAKSIVESLKGTIYAKNNLPNGLTVFIELPNQ